MKYFVHARSCATLLLIFCLLATATPVSALAKKGEKNYKQGLQYEAAQQWDRAAQEFALAVAADPSKTDYQLHYRRSVFNASQAFMQKGRSLAEQRDYVGAYNAFRQAYGYDPVNQLALSEMERMLRLQRDKEGVGEAGAGSSSNPGAAARATPTSYQSTGVAPIPARALINNQGQNIMPALPAPRVEQQRIILFNSVDLETVIRNLAESLGLNVVLDKDLQSQRRTISINLHDVTTSQALDYIFLTQGLFFQKLSRRTILVADQIKRPQYQQLVLRTFYLENAKPDDVKLLISTVLPAQNGRPPTTVVTNASTNSVTVRDTSENVRLIGELIRNIDKDRAEVVMDVGIYEVSHSDLVQFGNQFGDPSSNSLSIGGTSALSVIGGSRQVANQVLKSPTALGAALILPQTSFNAFQSKVNTRLVYSNQIHAFDGEASEARIGQRVPVQTAQTYPFGGFNNTNTTQGNVTQGVGFGGGFPVFNYEPTGLTLNFTPQVFPNLDVQVKMKIESKDVLNPSSLTPTFTERTINGTARIQNNRTMMLVSVAQNKQSTGRQGLPILGGLPIVGYLFASPKRDNVQSDIVITVTPRVLRAPAVEPRDEEMRPSGTFSTPTTGSLEAMLQESDRDDQLAAAAAARTAPANVTQANNNQFVNVPTNDAAKKTLAQSTEIEQLPAYVPAPKALMSSSAVNASTPTALSLREASATNAAEAVLRSDAPPLPVNVATELKATSTTPPPVAPASASSAVELRLVPELQEVRVGEKRRVVLMLKTDAPLGLVGITLRFDAHLIAVHGISPTMEANSASGAPILTQSIDAKNGVLLLSLTPPAGAPPLSGTGVLLAIDVEAIGAGESAISFDAKNTHIVATDGRNIVLQLAQSRINIKK
jgi:general secretion pathway protein D